MRLYAGRRKNCIVSFQKDNANYVITNVSLSLELLKRKNFVFINQIFIMFRRNPFTLISQIVCIENSKRQIVNIFVTFSALIRDYLQQLFEDKLSMFKVVSCHSLRYICFCEINILHEFPSIIKLSFIFFIRSYDTMNS